jgi:hypothetical protein
MVVAYFTIDNLNGHFPLKVTHGLKTTVCPKKLAGRLLICPGVFQAPNVFNWKFDTNHVTSNANFLI